MKTNLKSRLMLDNCLLKKEKYKNECDFFKKKSFLFKKYSCKNKKKSLNC